MDIASAVSDSMKERTGRSLEEWVELLEATSNLDPLDQKGVRAWLRDEHGVLQNSQWAIAFEVAGRAGWVMPSAGEFADALFSGAKSGLRPLHDAVVAVASSLPNTQVQGRATYTPVVRRTQFVAVAPGPRGTLRVGLRFKAEAAADERLSSAQGFASATHWLHLPAGADFVEAAAGIRDLIEAAWAQNG